MMILNTDKRLLDYRRRMRNVTEGRIKAVSTNN